MRKRSFRPAFESLDLRITLSTTVAAAGAADTVNPITGLPTSLYGGTDDPINPLTGLPASLYDNDEPDPTSTTVGMSAPPFDGN